MKNLKNLFLVGALLSTTALAAGPFTNPGDAVNNTGTAANVGVPLEVRVNIIEQGPELILVDETDTLIDTLTLDHGNKVLNNGKFAYKSQVEKYVIMKRSDNRAFNTEDSSTNKVDYYTAKFSVESPSYDSSSHTFTLTRLNSGVGTEDEAAKKIDTQLNFLDHNIKVKAEATEVRTLVTSVIKAGTPAESGLYVGTGTFVGSLTATLKGSF